MGRLIDADNLNFEGQNYNKSQMKAILDFVDAQPTAFDTKKVIKDIHNFKCQKCRNILGIAGADEYCEKMHCQVYQICKIVRKGGVE